MTTLRLKKLIDQSPSRLGFLLIPLVFACAALSPVARAVDPPPDGGYSGGNTAEGDGALASVVINIPGQLGIYNTAIGSEALFNNKSGNWNVAVGSQALLSNTGGYWNTAVGHDALASSAGGYENTATGTYALASSTFSYHNTAIGFGAMTSNTTGSNNTATGWNALGGWYNNNVNTGNGNTANGTQALFSNTTGGQNTAIGNGALESNTSGRLNTANGNNALHFNTTGNGNTAQGDGTLANTTGSYNTALGHSAGANLTTGHDNVDIQAGGVAGESNTTRIGTVKQTRTFISGIRGVTTVNANAIPVVIDSAGQLGTVSSSQRFKDQIEPMNNASEAIMGLNPVRFHYKADQQNTSQFGLIAEEVEKVNPDLVVRGEDGNVMTVRYEAVNAMLLNEFLKEHRKVEEQEATIAELKASSVKQAATVAQQQKQIEALTAGLQKITVRVEAANPAPLVVSDN